MKSPFTAEDLVRLDRVSDPQASADGRYVAFTVRETDMDANKGRTDLWLLDLDADEPQPRRLTQHEANDSKPRWSADGASLFFLSTRSGTSQVWRLVAGRRRGDAGHPLPGRRERAQGRAQGRASRSSAWKSFPTAPTSSARRSGSRPTTNRPPSGQVARPPVRAPLGHVEGRPHRAALLGGARRARATWWARP